MKPLNFKKIIVIVLFIICFIVLGISVYNIILWKRDSNKTIKQIDNLNDITNIESVEDSDNTEIIDNEDIKESDPYWDYIKMNLIDVDFNELKNINSEIAGWIQVKGTNINYPYVHTNNNTYYLNHSLDKSYNNSGWVFLDYRNDKDQLYKNNILYAHGRTDNTMFGSLKNILTNGWFNNTNNHVIKISTETENTLWQVFSVYRIPTTNDYIQINFNSDDDFLNLTKKLLNRSHYNFNTSVNANDIILTLSTCYNDSDKVVLHAKLIKREKA